MGTVLILISQSCENLVSWPNGSASSCDIHMLYTERVNVFMLLVAWFLWLYYYSYQGTWEKEVGIRNAKNPALVSPQLVYIFQFWSFEYLEKMGTTNVSPFFFGLASVTHVTQEQFIWLPACSPSQGVWFCWWPQGGRVWMCSIMDTGQGADIQSFGLNLLPQWPVFCSL